MKLLVEFCTRNYFLGTEKIKEQLEEDAEFDVLESDCTGHCERCMLTPFGLVEGEYVEADTPENLLKRIKEKAEEKIRLQKELEALIENHQE